MRAWLNSEFLNTAFTESEKSAVLLTDVDNSNEQGYHPDADVIAILGEDADRTFNGNTTQDYIFLMSHHEVFDLYMSGDWEAPDYRSRMCGLTDYAVANGAGHFSDQIEGKYAGWWWIRSPNCMDEGNFVEMFIDYSGWRNGATCTHDDLVIRPALWLNLDSDIF